MSLRNIALAGLVSISLLFTTGCETQDSAAAKKVASIDGSEVYRSEIFTNAEKELDTWIKAEVEARGKALEGKPDSEKAEALKLFEAEVEKRKNETLNPLRLKAEAAIAQAAKKQGASVVLDKKIVVYGVPDITEEVTKALASDGEITMPEGDAKEDAKTAPIGYFDQNIVRNLKVFKEAEVELFQERNKLMQSMQEEVAKAKEKGQEPSQAEVQAMMKAADARLKSLQQQKLTPLNKAVTDAVAQVAKDEGLSLVLDTQHVMYGGRNLTELVVDNFLKNVGKNGDAVPADPVPVETPAPAEGG